MKGYMEKFGSQRTKFVTPWVERYFEASGKYLRYYKSEAKEELLAAIDMHQVTMIFHLRAALSDTVGLSGEHRAC
jgi:hypothetical protein